MDKKALRKSISAQKRAMTEAQIEAASLRLGELFLKTEQYRDAKTILTGDFAKLHQVAEYLLDREKITGEEFEAVMRGEMLAEEEIVEEETFQEESAQPTDET